MCGIACWLVAASRSVSAALVLNEFMASNATTIADEATEFEDWIEILNTGPDPVDLTGMFLTDDLLDTTRWPIPTLSLGSGERVIIWADDEAVDGPLHANFRLEVNGEELGLFNTLANGNGPIDTITFGEQATDTSFGRFPDGTGPWIYMATATPNAANVDQGNIAPLVSGTDHEPNSPAEGQPVIVTARMRDLDGSLPPSEQRLFYNGGTPLSTLMYDDGQHNDGAAGDQIFGAEIPGFPGNTTVEYYVRARDNENAQTYDPPGAPFVHFSYLVGYVPPPLYLNEFLAANTTTNTDEFGEFDDWVEIFNAGSQPVDLTGLNLSDDFGNPDRFVFPAVILLPGDFLIIWCDGTPAQGQFHTSFRLAAEGEQIGLFASAANGFAFVDSVSFGLQADDVSMARLPDGAPAWSPDNTPTPDASNNGPEAVEPSTWGRIKRRFAR
jgi:hypothetical protein